MKETQILIERFETPQLPNNNDNTLYDEALKYCREICVVKLNDSWSRFCREVILLSSYAKPITISGIRVPLAPGIRKRNDVLPKLKSTYATRLPRNWEPRWNDPPTCINIANRLHINNYNSILNGLSIVTSPAEYINHIRNYICHKRRLTINNVINSLNFPQYTNIDDILTYSIIPGVTFFKKCVYEFRIMAQLALN